MIITLNAANAKNGIVTNPNHSMNLVVHEIPSVQGAADSGRIL